MSRPGRSLVVVGGGISGLAAAWFAAADGWHVTVLEASTQVGGKLQLASVAGVPVDVGAEAMLTARPEGLALLEAAGLAGERIAPSTTAAGVYAAGGRHALPARTVMGIPSDVAAVRESGLLSAAGVAAVAAEATLPPLPPLSGDVGIGELVRDRFGAEVLDRLVEPLLGGVYAGRAEAISLQAAVPRLAALLAERGGSLLAAAGELSGPGTRAPSAGSIFTSLRGGLARLPRTLAASGRFAVRTGVTVRALTRTPQGFALECGAVPQAEQVLADAVVLAVPAAKAARLLGAVAPAAAGELGQIQSASMAVLTFAFDGVSLPPGSGLLVAAGERLVTKAVTLSSQKWPLESGHALLRASVGRIGETHALQLPDEELIELVLRELRPLLGVTGRPVDALVTRWGGGLPQYAVGHVARAARVRDSVARVPGLAVCGAAFDGLGIPACIASARSAVDLLAGAQGGRGESSA